MLERAPIYRNFEQEAAKETPYIAIELLKRKISTLIQRDAKANTPRRTQKDPLAPTFQNVLRGSILITAA